MIDLHTHSFFRDGELIPSELVRRAKVAGYKAIAITDHGDHSNIDFIIPRLVKVSEILSQACDIMVILFCEIICLFWGIIGWRVCFWKLQQ